MNAPEIRPYHNEPEKRWLVCGKYRVAFNVSGTAPAQVASLLEACGTMRDLMALPHDESPGDELIEKIERQGFVEVIDCVGREDGDPGMVLRVSLKKRKVRPRLVRCGAKKEGEDVLCSMPAGHDCIHVGRKPDGGKVAWW